MKPPRTFSFTPTEEEKQYVAQQTSKVLAGNVSFGASTNNTDRDVNINCHKATGTSPGAPNTEFSISHGLGRIPIGFMVVSTDKAAHIYKGTTAWTTTQVFLKSDTASVSYFVILL